MTFPESTPQETHQSTHFLEADFPTVKDLVPKISEKYALAVTIYDEMKQPLFGSKQTIPASSWAKPLSDALDQYKNLQSIGNHKFHLSEEHIQEEINKFLQIPKEEIHSETAICTACKKFTENLRHQRKDN